MKVWSVGEEVFFEKTALLGTAYAELLFLNLSFFIT
jgi:hypothetical protein